MKKRNRYIPGDYYITCDQSGKKIKRSEAKEQWDGLVVEDKYWERRQPQDFVRGRPEEIAAEQPRSAWETDTFLSTNEVTVDDL